MNSCVHCKIETKERLCKTCLKDDSITMQRSRALKKYKNCCFDDFIITRRRYYLQDIQDQLASIKEKKEDLYRQRKNEIIGILRENSIYDFGIYQNELTPQTEKYASSNDPIDVHISIIRDRHDRYRELQEKLKAKNVPMRSDSYLYKTYIREGIESLLKTTDDMGKIKKVDDIIDIMEAMHFLHQKTDYQSIHESLYQDRRDRNQFYNQNHYNHRYRYEYNHYDSDDDSDEEEEIVFTVREKIARTAKIQAIKNWCSKNNKELLPKRLALLYPSLD